MEITEARRKSVISLPFSDPNVREQGIGSSNRPAPTSILLAFRHLGRLAHAGFLPVTTMKAAPAVVRLPMPASQCASRAAIGPNGG